MRALFSGAAAEGTALVLLPVTTASTDGLTVTTGTAWDSPTYDEGAVWGYSGANAGSIRKITAVSSTAGTVTVAFDRDIAVDDNFIRVPFWPLGTATVQFTTLFTQINVVDAVATNEAALRCLEIEHQDISGDGRTKSAGLFWLNDHVMNIAT